VGQIHGFIAKLQAKIPEKLLAAFENRRDDPQAVLELGVAWSTLQCSELLRAGAPGIHFYTMNRSARRARSSRHCLPRDHGSTRADLPHWGTGWRGAVRRRPSAGDSPGGLSDSRLPVDDHLALLAGPHLGRQVGPRVQERQTTRRHGVSTWV